MSLQITALNDSHLEDAAGLVCTRYQELRQQEPLLPARYEHPGEFLPKLRQLAGSAPGVAAMRSGKLVGFIAGYLIPEFLGVRAAYSPEWAHAVGLEDGRRIYEELYAHLSNIWVDKACLTHAFTLFGNDRVGLEALQWLSFGYAGVDAVREVTGVESKPDVCEIRRAKNQDSVTVAELISKLERHLASAPVFWPHELGETLEWLRDPANAMFLAEREGVALGCLGIGPANPEACTIIRDAGTASIISAYTQEAERGSGVATALLEQALSWARQQGYVRCAVDFEAMNYLARRFWTKWFRPVCYSLVRSINLQTLTA